SNSGANDQDMRSASRIHHPNRWCDRDNWLGRLWEQDRPHDHGLTRRDCQAHRESMLPRAEATVLTEPCNFASKAANFFFDFIANRIRPVTTRLRDVPIRGIYA